MAETNYFRKEITLSLSKTPFPATLAYRTYGSPSSPAILLPTCFGGDLDDTLPFLYLPTHTNDNVPPLPPSKYFIVVVGLLGGGESSSPSNTAPPFSGPDFPAVTYEDNIRLQHALLVEELGVKKLKAYIGFSMGGQQAYHFATLYPEFVENVVSIAASARTSWHNWNFLEGPKAALVNSVDFHEGAYTKPVVRGTRAFARVYSTWALSQEWYRQKSWEKLGFGSLEDYLVQGWEDELRGWDANNLLCMLHTWQRGDISKYDPEDAGDLAKTLRRLEQRFLVMPSRTDCYFPPEDNEFEVEHLRNGKLAVIESIWGHLAGGGGGTDEDMRFIQEQVQKFVEEH
jgi:homoserine O-acetyltransferase